MLVVYAVVGVDFEAEVLAREFCVSAKCPGLVGEFDVPGILMSPGEFPIHPDPHPNRVPAEMVPTSDLGIKEVSNPIPAIHSNEEGAVAENERTRHGARLPIPSECRSGKKSQLKMRCAGERKLTGASPT